MASIRDGYHTYRVDILQPEAELGEAEPTDVERRDAFINLWRRVERDWSKARLPFGSFEYAMAARIAQKYPLDILKRSVVYWMMHLYEPVRKDGKHPLRWFAYCLPEIQKELT